MPQQPQAPPRAWGFALCFTGSPWESGGDVRSEAIDCSVPVDISSVSFDAIAESRHAVRRAGHRSGARAVFRQPRRTVSYRRQESDEAAVGLAAMDLLRAGLQGTPA